VYAIYLVFLLTDVAAVGKRGENHAGVDLGIAFVYLVVGLVVVVGSAGLTVASATELAKTLDTEQSFIAIIIGPGSSLPELSISFAAAIKHRTRMSDGNLIGSNIFDTLIPIGVAAVIVDLEFNADMLRYELPFLFALSVIVLVFFYRTKGIQKREAATILGLYLGYATIKKASL